MAGSSDASAPVVEGLPRALLGTETRRRVSLATAALGFAAMAAIGGLQLAKNGSFWVDEASVAASLVDLAPSQLLGPLAGGQSYPRFQLLAIRGLVALFGYGTLVTRALPFLFFLAGGLAWMRLLALRFRDEPALVALGALLLLVPAPWFVYGAMLKPYTFDVLAAMVPFLLADRFYDEVLGEGRRPLRGVALAGLGALSYPYTMALLARVGAWWLWRGATGRLRVVPTGALPSLLAAGFCVGALWYTDLRHTSELGRALRAFWGACIVGDGSPLPDLLDRFAFGWWNGSCEFSQHGGVPPALLYGLRIAFVAGALRVSWTLVRRARPGPSGDLHDAVWGSRSLACALVVLGLPVASWTIGYPICAGRLTLFALLPLVVVALEGFDLAGRALRRSPRGGPALAAAAGLAVVLAVLPTSVGDARRLVVARPPGDLRGLLARTRERPQLPILTTSCTRKQLETLPEGTPATVLYLEQGGAIAAAARAPYEAWLVYTPASFCQAEVRHVRRSAETWRRFYTDADDARLLWLRFKKPAAPESREADGPG